MAAPGNLEADQHRIAAIQHGIIKRDSIRGRGREGEREKERREREREMEIEIGSELKTTWSVILLPAHSVPSDRQRISSMHSALGT